VTGPAKLKLVMDSPKYSDTDTIRALAIKQNINYITLNNLTAPKQISAHCIAKGFHKNLRQLHSHSQLCTKEAKEFHLEDISNIYKDILNILSKILCTYSKG
jgi:hypothetical protein